MRAPSLPGLQLMAPSGRQRQFWDWARGAKIVRAQTPTGAFPIFILHGARGNEHLSFGTGS
jgi:hypothetical protein